MSTKKETIKIAQRYNFTDAEFQAKASELADAMVEHEALLEEKKNVVSHWKNKIDGKATEIKALRTQVSNRYEMRDYDAYIEKDFDNQKRLYKDIHTDEVIREEKLSRQDYQLELMDTNEKVAENDKIADMVAAKDRLDSENVPAVKPEIVEPVDASVDPLGAVIQDKVVEQEGKKKGKGRPENTGKVIDLPPSDEPRTNDAGEIDFKKIWGESDPEKEKLPEYQTPTKEDHNGGDEPPADNEWW